MPAAMSARPALATRWIALALTPLALAGCGTKTARIDNHELRLRLEEFRFVPQSVSVPPGRLKIIAVNAGVLTHNVVVELVHRDSNGNPVIKAAIPTIMPGQTSLPLKVDLPPGHYLLVSTISNQADLGMAATLTVRGA
jgi:plastocyanin